MPSYTLHYFNSRGKAEVTRLVCAASGVSYEDKRYTTEEWRVFKEKTPAGQIPCLEIDGRMFCQSIGIATYIASLHGLYGNNALERIEIDQVVGTAGDLLKFFGTMYLEQDKETQEKLRTKLINMHAPRFAKIFERFLADNDYFVGNRLTLADIMVFETFDKRFGAYPEIFVDAPNLKTNMERVKANPGICAWLSARPKTEL